MKFINLTLLLMLFACKDAKTQTKLLTIEEWELKSKELLPELKEIRLSKNLEPNGGHNYEEDNSLFYIEVLEEMKTNEKIIDFTSINDEDRNLRIIESYRFFISSKKKIRLITTEEYEQNQETNKKQTKSKDTLLVNLNKISFWKNNLNATEEDLNIKEAKISKIQEKIVEYLEQ